MSIKRIAYFGMYLGIILGLSLIPYIGLITIGPVSINIITIVIIIASFHLGFFWWTCIRSLCRTRKFFGRAFIWKNFIYLF